jgi:hypothetical protein
MDCEYKLNCSIKPKAHVLILIGSVVTLWKFLDSLSSMKKNLELYISIQWWIELYVESVRRIWCIFLGRMQLELVVAIWLAVCDVDIFVCGFICVQSSGYTASEGDHTPWVLLVKILSWREKKNRSDIFSWCTAAGNGSIELRRHNKFQLKHCPRN